jgi:hypothetical protein
MHFFFQGLQYVIKHELLASLWWLRFASEQMLNWLDIKYQQFAYTIFD